MAAPFLPPASAPINAPTPAPPPIISALRFLCDWLLSLQVSVEIGIVSPFAAVSESSVSESSAGLLNRPELTTWVTLPVTSAPAPDTSTPLTVMGLASVPEKEDPSDTLPVSMTSPKRTSSGVPAGMEARCSDAALSFGFSLRFFPPPPFPAVGVCASGWGCSGGLFDWQPIIIAVRIRAVGPNHARFFFMAILHLPYRILFSLRNRNTTCRMSQLNFRQPSIRARMIRSVHERGTGINGHPAGCRRWHGPPAIIAPQKGGRDENQAARMAGGVSAPRSTAREAGGGNKTRSPSGHELASRPTGISRSRDFTRRPAPRLGRAILRDLRFRTRSSGECASPPHYGEAGSARSRA